MFFAFLGIFGGGWKVGWISGLGYFLCLHILLGLFYYGMYMWVYYLFCSYFYFGDFCVSILLLFFLLFFGDLMGILVLG